MSGEIVVVSSLFHAPVAAAPLLGAIAVGSLVYQIVTERQERARRDAEQAARRRKRDLQQWRAFQDMQQTRMLEQAGRWQALQERLQALRSMDPPKVVQAPERIHASGFLQQAQAEEEQRLRLRGLADLLAVVPSEVDAYSAGALARLGDELDRLQQQMERGPPPLVTVLDSLQALVEDTIEAARQRQGEEPRRQTQRLAELESLLDRLLLVAALAEGGLHERAEALEQRLLSVMQADSIGAAQTQGLRDELERLATEIETEHDNRLVLQQLQVQIRGHLEALGYHLLDQEGRGSLWAIPGGEQVRMSAQPDLRIAFQLQHERLSATEAPLDRAELALLRQQERRWCGDLKTLMKRLNADGFQFRVEFERQIPEGAVPVVVVQDVEEILRAQEVLGHPRGRETD